MDEFRHDIQMIVRSAETTFSWNFEAGSNPFERFWVANSGKAPFTLNPCEDSNLTGRAAMKIAIMCMPIRPLPVNWTNSEFLTKRKSTAAYGDKGSGARMAASTRKFCNFLAGTWSSTGTTLAAANSGHEPTTDYTDTIPRCQLTRNRRSTH